jgi:hypothetical protein
MTHHISTISIIIAINGSDIVISFNAAINGMGVKP